MPSRVYELVAGAMRYWFLLLMAVIAWRSWRWYRKDRHSARKRMKLLPDAGYIGEMIVMVGDEKLARGTALQVPAEGTLGSSRRNDLSVPLAGVQKEHLWFRFDEAKGLLVEPFRGNSVIVDGYAYASSAEPLYMLHGSLLQVGNALLRLRLFAGFDSVGYAQRPPMQSYAPVPQFPAAPVSFYPQGMPPQTVPQPNPTPIVGQTILPEGNAAPAAPAQKTVPPAERTEQPVLSREEYERIFMRPQNGTHSGSQGTIYPPVDDSADFVFDDDPPAQDKEDNPDYPALPKTAYVGQDEAAKAKRLVWDRYLGGGQKHE